MSETIADQEPALFTTCEMYGRKPGPRLVSLLVFMDFEHRQRVLDTSEYYHSVSKSDQRCDSALQNWKA